MAQNDRKVLEPYGTIMIHHQLGHVSGRLLAAQHIFHAFDCRLPQEPTRIFPLIDRHGGVMLHSISMEVLSVDERVKTGLDAPKNKNDSIIMALNNGFRDF